MWFLYVFPNNEVYYSERPVRGLFQFFTETHFYFLFHSRNQGEVLQTLRLSLLLTQVLQNITLKSYTSVYTISKYETPRCSVLEGSRGMELLPFEPVP